MWPSSALPGNFADEALVRVKPDFAHALAELGDPAYRGYDDGYPYPAPVGKFPQGASPYGALDMAGNVWEWCANWYDKDAYKRYATGDLTPPASGTFVVLRGGSCDVVPPLFRCADRNVISPDVASYNTGFRCVRGPE